MFILVFVSIFLLSIFLIFREKIKYPRLTPKTVKKILQEISKKIALNEWEEAEKELIEVMPRGGKEALLLYAQVLRGTNRLDQALDVAQSASREYPEELKFRQEEARIFLDLGKPKEALLCFRVCAPILRSESDFYECSIAHYQLGQIESCFLLLENWLKSTQNGKLFSLAASCQFDLKNYLEAVELYKKAVNLHCQEHETLTKWGHAYRKLGNLSKAEEIFKQILEKDPADKEATLGLGACFQERGWHERALLLYQNSPVWEAKDPLLLKQAGLCGLFVKNYPFAASCFKEAVCLTSPSPSLLFYYAYSLERAELWQEAEQTYLKLVKNFPEDGKGYRALAWLYGVGLSATLSAEEGLHYAHLALKHYPDSISWEILSACEARRGNFERAHEIQQKLLSSETDKRARLRRQHAMRSLRKHVPLDDQLVGRTLVA